MASGMGGGEEEGKRQQINIMIVNYRECMRRPREVLWHNGGGSFYDYAKR